MKTRLTRAAALLLLVAVLLSLLCACAGDYATVTVFVDGEQIGEPADLFRGGFKIGEPVTYGTVHLSAGAHTLVFKPLDKNARSRGYVFSIDRILFVRNADE